MLQAEASNIDLKLIILIAKLKVPDMKALSQLYLVLNRISWGERGEKIKSDYFKMMPNFSFI